MKRHQVAATAVLVVISMPGCSPGSTGGPGPQVSLQVDAATALVDQPVHLQVRGLGAGQEVEVRAQANDGSHLTWRSSAHFHADPGGTVDLSQQASEGGSYTGVDGMGLFWSMLPTAATRPSATPFVVSSLSPRRVAVSAHVNGKQVAGVTLERMLVAPGVTQTRLREQGLVGNFFSPRGRGRHTGVLVLGGSEGGMLDLMAALLASHGFSALALAYFGAEGVPAELANIPLEYFLRGLDWLAARPEVEPGHVTVIGGSYGAEAALLLAATFPQRFQAVVGLEPSAVVTQGVMRQAGSPSAAWTLGGQPLPFVPVEGTQYQVQDGALVARPGFERALEAAQSVPGAIIQVERIAAPLLLVSGTDDQLAASSRSADMIVARRKAAGLSYPDQNLEYQGAGHLILPPYAPTNLDQSLGLYDGGTPKAYAEADADSWPRVLRFLAQI